MNPPELRAVKEDISKLLDHIPLLHGSTVQNPSKGEANATSVMDTYVSLTLKLKQGEDKGGPTVFGEGTELFVPQSLCHGLHGVGYFGGTIQSQHICTASMHDQ